jgi:CDP-diacylglycerol pyrophosphatase
MHPNLRYALRRVVQDECVSRWRIQHNAVLADRKGGAHFLLIPTRTPTGIEDRMLLREPIPNDVAAAGATRERLEGPGFLVLAGRTPTRADVLLGIRHDGLVASGETLLDSSCAIDR